MHSSSGPTQKEIINSWNIRARAYHKLIGQWPIFTEMVDRLLEFIPEEFAGHALDIGGGNGLLAERLLARHPKAHVTLVEPAQEMRALAVQRLGDRIEIRDATGDQLGKLDLAADAALCSASFHLMNEETTLPAVASVLKRGSVFAANLWGHSFDATMDLDKKMEWLPFVDQALAEFGQSPPPRPKKPVRRIKNADELQKIGASCGLRLVETNIVTAVIKAQFNIEFAAMDVNFLNHVRPGIRAQVIDRALQLCHGVDEMSLVDLKFKKM